MHLYSNAQYQLTVASWDFAQSYPYKGDKPYDQDDLNIEKDGEGAVRQGISNRTLGSEWSWDVQALGSLEVHLCVPMHLDPYLSRSVAVLERYLDRDIANTSGRHLGHQKLLLALCGMRSSTFRMLKYVFRTISAYSRG